MHYAKARLAQPDQSLKLSCGDDDKLTWFPHPPDTKSDAA